MARRGTSVSVLEVDISAFERMRPELEARHGDRWVVFHKGEFAGAFSTFDEAAAAAVDRFDAGPYLIRQIGAPDAVQLAGGMVFTPAHALGAGRI